MNLKKYKIFLLFIAVVLCAYMVRDLIYKREAAAVGNEYKRAFGRDIHFVPFMVESSMMYSYAKDVGCGDGIKEFDNTLVGMNKLSVHRQFTTALEYFLGYGYKLKNKISPSPESARAPTDYEDNPDFSSWIRIQLRFWISLISGFIFLYLIVLRIPWQFAFLGGIIHAVSSAAIARYTAQDIVRGNFSLPFIVAAFLTAAWFLRTPSLKKLILTALLSFAALASWDMTQICFSIWALSEIIRILAGGRVNRKRRQLWITLLVSAIFASLIIPYHREHHLIVSPLILIMYPLVIVLHRFSPGRTLKVRLANFAIALFSLYGAWFVLMKLGSFGGNYSHFAELMKAKIRFLNVKPSNPDMLTFEARSVWVPAMHSADRFITKAMFPMILTLTGIALILSLTIKPVKKAFFKNMGIVNFPLFMSLFYSISFFFLVRYHVFAIIFLSMLFPLILYLWMKNAKDFTLSDTLKSVVITILWFTAYNLYFYGVFTPKALFFGAFYPILGFLFAAALVSIAGLFYRILKHKKPLTLFYGKGMIAVTAVILLIFEVDGLQRRRRYEQYFFPQVAELIRWIRHENVDVPIMADFELSPMLKAYCHSKIILQPKFELGKTRENYERFMHIMFHEDENALAHFCIKNGAQYFIFDKGYPHSRSIYSPMYMAAAHSLKPNSPANMMDLSQNRNRLRNFYEIKPPQALQLISRRYILFKVISEKDKTDALKWAYDSEKMMRTGKLEIAARLAKAAIFADPNCPQADIMYRKLYGKSPYIRLRGY
jgi:hypothetical protein